MALHEIKDILENYTRDSFARMQVDDEKEAYNDNYYEHMEMWTCEKDYSIDECILASYNSSAKKYDKMQSYYLNWINSGKLYLLDTKEMILYFIASDMTELLNKDNIVIIPEYNPLKIDIYEASMNYGSFKTQLTDERFVLSKNRHAIKKELDSLVLDCL